MAIDYFLKAQSPEERRRFAFEMFDIGGTGFITESDLMMILEKGAGSHFSAKQLQTVSCCGSCLV